MRLVCLVFIALLWVSASALAAATPDKAKPVSAEEIAKMDAAAPAQARARPEKPRRLLVVSIAQGFWHDSIPYGKKAIEALAKKTGAFEAVVSDDLANFEPQSLAKFDAVAFNNTNNEFFLPENYEQLSGAEKKAADRRDAALKKSFSEWLAGGKGLVLLHVGIGSFRKWPEFGEIAGARFDGHPWASAS